MKLGFVLPLIFKVSNERRINNPKIAAANNGTLMNESIEVKVFYLPLYSYLIIQIKL